VKSQWRSEIRRFSNRDCQLVLDEGQRIKNWETRTTQTIKSGSRKHMQRTSGDWVGGHSIR
jgi:hypothetical protein